MMAMIRGVTDREGALACQRHPGEAYVTVGLRVYSDGALEPYIKETGSPIAITNMVIDAPLDGAIVVNLGAYVQSIEWYGDPKEGG